LTDVREVIRDLLRNTPCGDYTPEELFKLNIHSRYCCESVIYELYYSEKYQYQFQVKGCDKGVLKRRCARLWERIGDVVSAVAAAGGEGVYRVWMGIDTVGYLWAADLETAQRLGDTLYSYLAVAGGHRDVKVSYVRACSYAEEASTLEPLIAELRNRAQREIEEAERSLVSAEKKLLQARTVLDLVDPCKTDGAVV
jgi:hypothetical protein